MLRKINPQTTPKQIIINNKRNNLASTIRELWQYRGLLYFLTWRDIKVRYKQTFFGILWAIIQPIMTMVVFSFILGNLAKLPSQGIPYPIYSFAGLLPWQLFAFALNSSGNSVVENQALISKVYFPRFIAPLASVLSGTVDFAVSFVILVGMMLFFNVPITTKIAILPILVFYTLITALSVGFWLSALNVKYRDVRYAIPFIIQTWFFITPIVYSSELIPEQWKFFYSLNPMTSVIAAFRWSLFDINEMNISYIIGSIVLTLFIFIGGIMYFNSTQEEFADHL
jgi:lipopolysaccharide transport system permease protein